MSEGPGSGGGHSANEKLRPDHIRIEQRVDASRPVLWNACAAPLGLAGWQADSVEGDVRPGGRLTLSWPTLGASVLLDVVEVEPQERIELENGDARLAMRVDEKRITLTHIGLGPTDDVAGMEASWRIALSTCAHFCERHPSRSRSVHWFLGSTHTSAAAAYAFFTDAAALATWLCARGGVPAEGARHELELQSGRRLSGRVLANVSGHDVALTWDEDEASVLCMRTLPSPNDGERLVALCWSRWSESPPDAGALGELEAAHERLMRVLDQRLWA